MCDKSDKNDTDDLDLLLSSALASYTDPGSPDGLEPRILAHVSAETPAQPRRRWLPWAIALPVAASLLLAILVTPRPAAYREITVPQAPGHASASSQAVNPPDTFAAQAHSVPHTRVHYADTAPGTASQPPAPPAVASLPKRDVFPTPQPLTPAEQALAAYAAEAPERQSLIEAQKRADTPLTIAAIHIPPLSPPDKGANSPDPGTN